MVVKIVDYNNQQRASDYDSGRGLDLDALQAWRSTLEQYLSIKDGLRIVDVGSGTGTWSFAFAEWFDAYVIAIEPAEEMLELAKKNKSHPRISYIKGGVEHLPVSDGYCDAAWLSTVIHHISDLRASARELRRVLRADSPVLIRSSFPTRHDDITLFKYFPEASKVANTFPTVEEVLSAFGSVGFKKKALISVPQISAPSLHDFYESVSRNWRSDSTLASINEEDIYNGTKKLQAAAAKEKEPTPVIDKLDLLVLK